MMYFLWVVRHEFGRQYLFLLASKMAFLVGQNWDKIPRHSMII